MTLIPLSDPDGWREALRGIPHAFAHTWESCFAMERTTNWPTSLFSYEAGTTRVVCPFAERSFKGAIDAVTPYGFSGFVGTGGGPEVLEAWREVARRRQFVCAYIGLNPVLDPAASWADGEAEAYSEVFVLDLRPSEEELLRGLPGNRRRAVAQWQRDGHPLMLDRERLTAMFLDSYSEFMIRRGAAPVYRFSRASLEYLLALDNVLLLGAGDGERVEAVAVFAHSPAVAEYLFSVSVPGGEHHSTRLVWEGALRLRRLGIPVLNLGGGIRVGDGVADFKRRFGGVAVPLRRLRQVYDAERFEVLCRQTGVDPTDRSGYFPPYRAA